MRKFIVAAGVFVALVAAVAVYLAATTPEKSDGVRFPLPPRHRALLEIVPASAEAFALVPAAAAFRQALVSNPVAHEPVRRWEESHSFPPAWVIGRGDLVAWRTDEAIGYAIALDPIRAFLVRLYVLASDLDGRVEGNLFVAGVRPEQAISPHDIDAVLSAGAALPAGDALMVQRETARGAFPPIARPALSIIKVGARDIEIAARSINPGGGEAFQPVPSERTLAPNVRYPRSALMTVAFAEPPRVLSDVDRLLQAKVSRLLEDGGAIALYEVDTAKLLPRPREVIILPATDERRTLLEDFVRDVAPEALRKAVGFRIETADTGRELLVAFDRDSIDRYRRDSFEAPLLNGDAWSVRIDPARVIPMLDRVSDSPGLRYVTPRLFRSARDLERWIGALEDAGSIEAAASRPAGVEELRVLIRPK